MQPDRSIVARLRSGVKWLFFLFLEVSQLNRLFRRRNRGKIKVLLYHIVSDGPKIGPISVSRDKFSKQLRYLRKHCNFVRLTQRGEWVGVVPDRVNVLLTFDDGFISVHRNVLPLCREHSIAGCVFAISDCVAHGDPPPFSSTYDDPSHPELRTMTARELLQIAQQGFTIGSHSARHPDFCTLSEEDITDELSRSKNELQRIVDQEIGLFAFPWGWYTQPAMDRARVFYRRVFVFAHGFNLVDDTILKSNEAAGTFHMCAVVSGARDWLLGK